jgi:hypothetical protein
MVGLIYKLSGGGLNYYGSTEQTLNQRLSKHKYDYKRYLEGKMHYLTSFNIIDKNDYNIELVEEVEDLAILTQREQFYINNFECVNKATAYRSFEEQIELAKITRKIASQTEHYKLRKKKDDEKYRKKYDEKIKSYKNEKIECDNCKKLVSRSNLRRHQKTSNCNI